MATPHAPCSVSDCKLQVCDVTGHLKCFPPAGGPFNTHEVPEDGICVMCGCVVRSPKADAEAMAAFNLSDEDWDATPKSVQSVLINLNEISEDPANPRRSPHHTLGSLLVEKGVIVSGHMRFRAAMELGVPICALVEGREVMVVAAEPGSPQSDRTGILATVFDGEKRINVLIYDEELK